MVNDDDSVLYIQKHLFAAKGFNVQTAMNGFEAFEIVKQSLQQSEDGGPPNLFDLVLLDLEMPITNGYEACR